MKFVAPTVGSAIIVMTWTGIFLSTRQGERAISGTEPPQNDGNDTSEDYDYVGDDGSRYGNDTAEKRKDKIKEVIRDLPGGPKGVHRPKDIVERLIEQYGICVHILGTGDVFTLSIAIC